MAPEDVSRLVSGIGRKCIDVAATPSGRRLGDVWDMRRGERGEGGLDKKRDEDKVKRGR